MTLPKNNNAMKLTKIFNLMMLGASLTILAGGCRKSTLNTTHIKNPADSVGGGTGLNDQDPLKGKGGTGGEGANGITPLSGKVDDWPVDPSDPLHAETIHFDYDKSAIRSSEQSHLDNVASYLKSHAGVGLRVEGNCDERGTEEYNRSLGERRAAAAREYLIRAGCDATLITTRSYGLDHPVDTGKSEAAHAKNRRDDFVVLLPPGAK
jgi:peptidoglycan-associated lipoprotein